MGARCSNVADRHRERLRLARAGVPVALLPLALLIPGVLSACDDEPAEPGVVEPADAYTAIVSWQASEQEPVVNEDGEEQLPVIYVVAANGDPIAVGVQAAVAEATTDEAVVRFADDPNESFDTDIDGAPVHDHGVMLSVGVIPDAARSVDIDVGRFDAKDDYQMLAVNVTANNAAPGDSTDEAVQRASVTAVIER